VSARIAHLELHTSDLHGACAFYRDLLDWDNEQIGNPWGVYQSLEMGSEMSGGAVECGIERPYPDSARLGAA
jgi:predicted enzyme related to lactoylglutathione lyase